MIKGSVDETVSVCLMWSFFIEEFHDHRGGGGLWLEFLLWWFHLKSVIDHCFGLDCILHPALLGDTSAECRNKEKEPLEAVVRKYFVGKCFIDSLLLRGGDCPSIDLLYLLSLSLSLFEASAVTSSSCYYFINRAPPSLDWSNDWEPQTALLLVLWSCECPLRTALRFLHQKVSLRSVRPLGIRFVDWRRNNEVTKVALLFIANRCSWTENRALNDSETMKPNSSTREMNWPCDACFLVTLVVLDCYNSLSLESRTRKVPELARIERDHELSCSIVCACVIPFGSKTECRMSMRCSLSFIITSS